MRRAMRGARICDAAVAPALKGGPSDPILEPRLSEWLLWSVGSSPAQGYAPGIACLHSFGVRLRWAGGLAIRARRNASRKRGVSGLLFVTEAWFIESNGPFFQGGYEPNCHPLLASPGGAIPEMGATATEGGTQARGLLDAPRCRVAGMRGLDDDLGSARSRPSRASVLPGAGSGALRIRSSPVGPRREAGFVEASRKANGALLGDGIRRTG